MCSSYLIIEDDKVINDYIGTVIGSKGAAVYKAYNTKDALGYLKNFNLEIDYILLDFSLPSTHASVVMDLIRNLRSDVKVFLVSGYDIDYISKQFPVNEIEGFIQKPFALKDLVNLVLPNV